jgi:hypothetical protein
MTFSARRLRLIVIAALAGCTASAPPPPTPGTAGSGGRGGSGRAGAPGSAGTGGESGSGGSAPGGAGGSGGGGEPTAGTGGAPAKPDGGTGAGTDAAPPAGSLPIGMVGNTACLNADGKGGKDTYALIDSVLGDKSVEHNPDMDHMPPFQHVQEDTDSEVGNHFVFFAHFPQDNDGAPGDDRSRIEIKVNTTAAEALRARPGDTMTYHWRFKMNADMKFSNRFTHMHQIKSFGGNDGAPVITITGSGSGASENLRVDHWGDGTDTTTLARVPLAGLKGIWLEVTEKILVDDNGSISITIKKPDGTKVIDVTKAGLDFWRQGEYIRGKWGIYRGKSDQLKTGEETVRFANFAITKGTAPPTTDCR